MTTATLRDTSATLTAECGSCGEIFTAQVDQPRRAECCGKRLSWPKAPTKRVRAKPASGRVAAPASDAAERETSAAIERENDSWRAKNYGQELEDRRRLTCLGEILQRPGLERHEREWAEELLRYDDQGAPEAKVANSHARDRADHLISKYVSAEGKVKHSEPPPALAEAWQERPEAQIVMIDLESLVRHPDNRHPTKEAIAEKAESLAEDGQLEPIEVWQAPGLPQGKLQILSGETRFLAAKKLGWQTIQGRIVTGIDAPTALDLVAKYNGLRRDLNPIEKARLIARLCEPAEQGGRGLTREQAAKRVGGESAAWASQHVGLLELPKYWQDVVARGEFEWTWARSLVRLAKAQRLLDLVKAAFERREKPKGYKESQAWATRKEFEEWLDELANEHTRPVDAGDEFYYGWNFWKNEKSYEFRSACQSDWPILFDLTPELERQLDIVEIEVTSGRAGTRDPDAARKVRRATNVKLYDQHQLPAIRAKALAKSKAKAEKAGRDEKVKPEKQERKLSAAEQKQRAADRARQLGERIAGWRHQLLRRGLVFKIDGGFTEDPDSGLRLILAYAAGGGSVKFGDLLTEVTAGKATHSGYRPHYWQSVAGLKSDLDIEAVLSTMAVKLLEFEGRDPRYPLLPLDLVEGYAADLGVDVETIWHGLADPGSGYYDTAFLEQFFLLHQTEQLRDLATELKVHLPPAINTRAKMATFLCGVPTGTRRLPLPKSVKPLAAAEKKKPKRKAK